MIRLVAVDMDGTLLNSQSAISSKNRETVLKLQESGTEFLICTGRFYPDARDILSESGITCGFICLSGASTYDADGRQLNNLPFARDQLKLLVELLRKHAIPMDFLTSHGAFTSFTLDEKLEQWKTIFERKHMGECTSEEIRKKAEARMDTLHFLEHSEDIFKHETDVYKICIDNIEEDMVLRLKKEFVMYPQFAVASSFPTNIEITDAKAQKGIALKAYADAKGIPSSQVMAIGDSDNDLSMFTMDFGYPVAMANAMDCIKQKAKCHTLSNDEDGVAWAIETYILSK